MPAYLLAKKIVDRAVGLVIGLSSAIVALYAILFGTDLGRMITYQNMPAVVVLGGFLLLMANGLAAILAGIAAGTLLRMVRNP